MASDQAANRSNPRDYLRLSWRATDHAKLVDLRSDRARWAWIVALSEAKQQDPEGEWPSERHARHSLGAYGSELRELIRVGLLELTGDGRVSVHDWREWQMDRQARYRADHRRELARKEHQRRRRGDGRGDTRGDGRGDTPVLPETGDNPLPDPPPGGGSDRRGSLPRDGATESDVLQLLEDQWGHPPTAGQQRMLREIADRRQTKPGNGWDLMAPLMRQAIADGEDAIAIVRAWDERLKAEGLARAKAQEARSRQIKLGALYGRSAS